MLFVSLVKFMVSNVLNKTRLNLGKNLLSTLSLYSSQKVLLYCTISKRFYYTVHFTKGSNVKGSTVLYILQKVLLYCTFYKSFCCTVHFTKGSTVLYISQKVLLYCTFHKKVLLYCTFYKRFYCTVHFTKGSTVLYISQKVLLYCKFYKRFYCFIQFPKNLLYAQFRKESTVLIPTCHMKNSDRASGTSVMYSADKVLIVLYSKLNFLLFCTVQTRINKLYFICTVHSLLY